MPQSFSAPPSTSSVQIDFSNGKMKHTERERRVHFFMLLLLLLILCHFGQKDRKKKRRTEKWIKESDRKRIENRKIMHAVCNIIGDEAANCNVPKRVTKNQQNFTVKVMEKSVSIFLYSCLNFPHDNLSGANTQTQTKTRE